MEKESLRPDPRILAKFCDINTLHAILGAKYVYSLDLPANMADELFKTRYRLIGMDGQDAAGCPKKLGDIILKCLKESHKGMPWLIMYNDPAWLGALLFNLFGVRAKIVDPRPAAIAATRELYGTDVVLGSAKKPPALVRNFYGAGFTNQYLQNLDLSGAKALFHLMSWSLEAGAPYFLMFKEFPDNGFDEYSQAREMEIISQTDNYAVAFMKDKRILPSLEGVTLAELEAKGIPLFIAQKLLEGKRLIILWKAKAVERLAYANGFDFVESDGPEAIPYDFKLVSGSGWRLRAFGLYKKA